MEKIQRFLFYSCNRDLFLTQNHPEVIFAAMQCERGNLKGNGTGFSLDTQSSSSCALQNVKVIEMWIYNLLNLPVPFPGKVLVSN